MANEVEVKPFIRRYNATSGVWEYVYPKTFASLVTYDGTTQTIKDVVDSKASSSDIKNSTIIIQKNGVQVDTFTLNAASNKTINILDVASANVLDDHLNASNPHNITPSLIGALATSARGAANGVASLDSNKKILLSELPDIVLGQVMYGGTIAGTTATITLALKNKLGITSNTITIVNSENDTSTAYGYKTLEGVYFISTSSTTLWTGLTVVTGDWVISTGNSWTKIDNTDAVTSVNNQIGAVNLTAEDIMYNTSDTVFEAIESLGSGKQDKVTVSGSSATKPVYVSSNGVFSVGNTYAGGTKVTLNGTDKASSDISIWAPTAKGTSNQYLKMNSAGTALEWASLPAFTDTWRAILVNGTQVLNNTISGGNINFKSGTNVSLAWSALDNSITFSSTAYTAGAGLTLDGSAFKLAIAMGTTAPANPANGCIWFDTSN